METLFGQKSTTIKVSSEIEKKSEKKRIRKEITELEDLIKQYTLYLEGKKSCVLTMEQVKEDIKKAKERLKVLKKL